MDEQNGSIGKKNPSGEMPPRGRIGPENLEKPLNTDTKKKNAPMNRHGKWQRQAKPRSGRRAASRGFS